MKMTVTLFMVLATTACTQEIKQNYVPGLGDFMSQLGDRHAKLWIAGKAQNWALADYQLKEIDETFELIGKYHPNHDEIQAIPAQIQSYLAQPISETKRAIESKNYSDFVKGYDAVTSGCNSCHQSNGFGFNKLAKPNN